MSTQDWTPVTIHGKPTTTYSAASANANAAAAIHHKGSPEAAHARKLAEADDIPKLKKLLPQSRQEIVTRRAAEKWSQQDLNQRCNFPVNTIREIEAGRLQPTIQQLNTLNRVLKTGLKMG
jgi:ribosome-binding protein aMBF1 (putative translation factor)